MTSRSILSPRRTATMLMLAATMAGIPRLGLAQSAATTAADVFLRGVPASAAAEATPLSLSLADAVKRGLQQNLGIILEQERSRSADGRRLTDLSKLLPHLSGDLQQTDQKVNLAAFGFTGFPGIPQVIGPFGVFDARLSVSTPVFDAEALGDWRESRAAARAEAHTALQARETVVYIVSALYLEAVADASLVDLAHAEVTTAEALATLAADQKAAGLIAGIDVLRQQVQLETARAKLINAEQALANQTLKLARAIGVDAAQAILLTDHSVFTPLPDVSVDALVAGAAESREDLKSAEARVDAARAAHQAAVGTGLPSVHLVADVAATGDTATNTFKTYAVTASVHVPIFEGGNTRGKVITAAGDLRASEADLADLRAGVRFDVLTAVHDISAAEARVTVAKNAETLARQQLDQAQDRFRAGVASTIELVQAEQSVATAAEQVVASIFAHVRAKASLARAIGQVESRYLELVGGQR